MHIDKKEALRYMGYRGQSINDNMEGLLNDCIAEVMDISEKSFVYEVFDIERVEEGLCLKETTLILKGEDIQEHLAKSAKCAVMAVTLGLEVDKRIAFYSRTDLTRGLIFDACAAAAVEALCDTTQEEIEAKAKTMGLEITSRYSPGYGDFPIDLQKEIAKVLKTHKMIGLAVNEYSIMIPRKSVTAVIGMQSEGCSIKSHKCGDCEDKHCLYRKDRDDDE